MIAKVQNIYDYSLFENHTDKQLSEIYKVSTKTISFKRRKFASHTNSLKIAFDQNTARIDDIILTFIKNHPNNISISEFLKANSLSTTGQTGEKSKGTQYINQKRFLKIASEHNIEINFSYVPRLDDKIHGTNCFKKCKCYVGRFALALHNKSKKSKNKKHKGLSFKIINYFANKYFDAYQELNPLRKKGRTKIIIDFYAEIFKEIDEVLNYQDLDSGLLANKNSENKIHTKYIFAKSNMNKDVTDFNLPLMF